MQVSQHEKHQSSIESVVRGVPERGHDETREGSRAAPIVCGSRIEIHDDLEIIDRRRPSHEPRSVRLPHDLEIVHGDLLRQFAHQRLEDVVQRDDAGYAAVFVERHRGLT